MVRGNHAYQGTQLTYCYSVHVWTRCSGLMNTTRRNLFKSNQHECSSLKSRCTCVQFSFHNQWWTHSVRTAVKPLRDSNLSTVWWGWGVCVHFQYRIPARWQRPNLSIKCKTLACAQPFFSWFFYIVCWTENSHFIAECSAMCSEQTDVLLCAHLVCAVKEQNKKTYYVIKTHAVTQNVHINAQIQGANMCMQRPTTHMATQFLDSILSTRHNR
jgi:hypothetical protein